MILLQSPPAELALFSIRLLISMFATADILLRKNDVRAAFGWIAAVWFSPIMGGILYYLFGVNRVNRRALSLSRKRPRAGNIRAAAPSCVAPNLAALSQIGERVTSVPLSAGNGVVMLRGGDEAYPAMLAAIKGAKSSVALTTYIFRNDDIGREFTDALSEAHRRGVAVRVLLDSIGAGYFFPKPLRRLWQAGVHADQFLHTWIPWRMPFLNMRSHRKILICDGALAFTGGLNIGAEYAQSRAGDRYVQDTHFRVEGPVVAQLMDTFAQDWCFTTGENLEGHIWWPKLHAKGEVYCRGIRSGPDADIFKIETLLGAALGQARKHVRIVTPYFLPGQNLQFAIKEAQLRGVTIDIVLPEKCDARYMDWAIRGNLRSFRHIPVNFHICPPPFDHSKLATVDGQWCLFGSSNWDVRSHRLNFEFDLESYDESLVTQIDGLIDKKIAGARKFDPVEITSWPKWIQLRNAATHLLAPYL